MRDDFLSADWAEHHDEMSNGIHNLIKSIAAAFAILTARQFDAPWKKDECEADG